MRTEPSHTLSPPWEREGKIGRRLTLAALAIALLAPLAACGRRGPPRPPEDEPNTYPRTYPRA